MKGSVLIARDIRKSKTDYRLSVRIANDTGIGIQSLRRISEEYGGKLVLWVGNKRLFKRKPLEEYLEKEYSI